MDDLGAPLILETPIYKIINMYIYVWLLGGCLLLSRRRHPTFCGSKNTIKKSFKSLKRAGEWFVACSVLERRKIPTFAMAKNPHEK